MPRLRPSLRIPLALLTQQRQRPSKSRPRKAVTALQSPRHTLRQMTLPQTRHQTQAPALASHSQHQKMHPHGHQVQAQRVSQPLMRKRPRAQTQTRHLCLRQWSSPRLVLRARTLYLSL